MPVRSSASCTATFVVVSALALAPALARGAGPADECVRLVSVQLQKLDRSPVNELQLEVQASQVTAMMIDALGKKLGLGAAWKAGNPSWEEAYALFRPDLLAAMRAGATREVRRIQAKLPALLDGNMCRKAVALLDSRTGAVAVRIEDANETRAFLASFEKQFGVPAGLKEREAAARHEIAEAAALEKDPEIRKAPGLAAAREEWRGYGRQYAAAMKRLGDADPTAEQQANQEASARMMAKNQGALGDIVRRFRAAR